MKYVMFEMDMYGTTKKLPIIFPDDLIHEDISISMKPLIANSLNLDERSIIVVSAGFLNSFDCLVKVSGKSDTLGVSSDSSDDMVIKMYDYMHGL